MIDRLERIEKETMERLNNEHYTEPSVSTFASDPSRIFSRSIHEYDLWKEIENLKIDDPPTNVNDLFKNITPVRNSYRGNESDSDV